MVNVNSSRMVKIGYELARVPRLRWSHILYQLLKGHRLKLTYFTAAWCQPCKATKPHVQAFAEQYGIDVEYVDIDSPTGIELATRHSVMTVPTFVTDTGHRFSGGQTVASLITNCGLL